MLTETGKYVAFGDIQVHEVLKDAIEKNILPGTGVSAVEFWSHLEKLLAEFSDENAALLAHRDELQAAIDEWYEGGCKEDQEGFLKRIGYLVEPPTTKTTICVTNVDPEMSLLAGPQLVVPVDNARYALNAANARWGSLFDAVYGFDVIPGRPGPGGYDPSRGLAVLEFAFKQLDGILPLVDAQWAELASIWVDHRSQLVASTTTGKSTGLKSPSAFVGYRGNANKGDLVFVHNGLHIIIKIHKESQVGKQNSMGLSDVVLESALTAIMDCEDSVAAVDAEDKSRVYSNWAGLMRGDLETSFKKGGKSVTRRLNSDLTFRMAGGKGIVTLPGRVVALVRNVGIHMRTDAVLYRGDEAFEGLVDALVTATAGLLDLRQVLALSIL
ncbi:Malate synthase G, putative [Perkinsus marinus ATCC 50983]|uniref:Malate synthase G, putative n=1 Tax=Perkinsus marinus (strain ATCC 50983 / TXsc) TaxID=423536 RepID=C5LI07_PERM5|nr:Malate synthase G, putative [Perkinsus marinus ATCC 50983]EER03636.1 Malate synthase G, putative [Perkinsus marinus ATCC 50983]|eukprot:XP_002771820.1 Malate synthase G, putative [Perkinsus marinus ATCC 50983]